MGLKDLAKGAVKRLTSCGKVNGHDFPIGSYINLTDVDGERAFLFERQHHSGSSCVRYEHREQTRDEQEAQKHHFATSAEGLQQHLRQLGIESRLRGGNGQHETTDEQHDDGIGKRCHHAFIRQ